MWLTRLIAFLGRECIGNPICDAHSGRVHSEKTKGCGMDLSFKMDLIDINRRWIFGQLCDS